MTVAEISSFQLETIEAFRPEIGVLLNLTPDHLDRHDTFEQYAAAKMRHVRKSTRPRLSPILNADDPGSHAAHAVASAHLLVQPQEASCARRISCVDGQIIFRADGSEKCQLAGASDIPLRGEHNVENVLAACSAAYLAGADASAIAAGVKSFPGVEHRLEFVAEKSTASRSTTIRRQPTWTRR